MADGVDDRADGQSGSMTLDVSVVVVEEGVYTVAEHGVTMEAVTYNSTVTAENNNWAVESRSFQNTYTTPVVVGQVMSYNDANWSVFWSRGSNRQSPVDASHPERHILQRGTSPILVANVAASSTFS